MTHTLITGGTGLVGSFLLRDALLAGRPVVALARGPRAQQRVDRLLGAMGGFFGLSLPPVKVLNGDLGAPGLGLSPQDLAWVGENCDRVLHCAGALNFVADGRGEPYLTNVDGTRHLLAMCAQAGIGEFHYVSTAYVCGANRSKVQETDLDSGQSFHNDYERSKFLAEVLVRNSGLDHVTVFRPSVVLGDAVTGFSSSFQGVYSMLWAGWANARLGVTTSRFLKELNLAPEDGVNLITVDWLSQTLWQLLGQKSSRNRTYHLTNPHSIRWIDLYECLADCVPSGEKLTTPEVAEKGLLEVYLPYFSHHPDFDDTFTVQDAPHLPCPVLDPTTLRRICRFAVERGFKSEAETDFRGQLVGLLQSGPLSGPSLVLEVPGPEGGTWTVGTVNGRVCPSTTEPGLSHARVFCPRSTMGSLACGKITVEQALYSGQMVLEGEPDSFSPAIQLLQDLTQQIGREN